MDLGIDVLGCVLMRRGCGKLKECTVAAAGIPQAVLVSSVFTEAVSDALSP